MTLHSADTFWQPQPACGDARLRRWLIDRGSLTRRIQVRCERFRVDVLSQRLDSLATDERAVVGARPGTQALVREVSLNCGTKPVVFAHSVVEPQALRGPWHMLMSLGARPLGAALFSDPRVERCALRYRQLGRWHMLYRRAAALMERPPASFWARRSLFILRGSRLLVTEVFLPEILALAP